MLAEISYIFSTAGKVYITVHNELSHSFVGFVVDGWYLKIVFCILYIKGVK